MASITKYGDRWRAQVAIKGERRSAVWDTKREAVRWADRVEDEIRSGLKGGNTFADAVEKYLRTVSPTKRNPKWERHRFNAFKEELGGDTLLAEITSGTIGDWRDKRMKTVVGATVQRESNLLRNLFTVALDEWKWITVHPFKGVRMPVQADARHQVWRWQEMKRVLRADRRGKTGEVIAAFRIALHTGLRLAEILEGEFDAQRKVFTLERSKTTNWIEVPLPRRALKLFPARFTVGANEASTLFSKLRRQLLLDGLTFHDTRGTALTLLARRVDVMTLARISRHRDLKTLLNTYYRESAEQISARI